MQKEIKSNEQLKTLLFLQLELQELEKVYSVFSDFLFFFAKYIFLFETTSPEPASIKPTHTKFETLCSTPDPARDGGNWYAYCNNNPLKFVDLDGMEYFNGEEWVSSNTKAEKHRKSLIIKENYIPEGNNNRPGDKIVKVKGVVIHWTEFKNQSPADTINWWIREGKKENGTKGSAHYVIGTDGIIYASVPEDEFALHSGQNLRNNYLYTDKAKSLLSDNKDTVNYFLIGIEMEPNKSRKEGGGFDSRTIESATLLVAELMVKYNLSPETDLYRHYDMTGKDCPLYYVDDERWKSFVDSVKDDMEYLKRKK